MEALLQRFLEEGKNERGYSVHTLKGYRADIRAFCRWLAGEHSVTEPAGITLALIQRYDVWHGNQDRRPRSRRRKIAAIRAFTGWLTDTGQIKDDPARKVKLPANDDPSRTAPTLAEKEALMDGCRRLRTPYRCTMATAVMACMFYAGLRPMEVIALQTADVDMQRRRLLARGKGKKLREIPINGTLAAYLSAWLSVRTSPLSALFVTTPRRPFSYPILRLLFIEIKIVAGLRDAAHLTAHCLRHWFASEIHSQGTDVVVIQKLLGHQNLNTTQTYLHCMQSDLDEAVRGLDARPPGIPDRAKRHAVRRGQRRMP